MTVSPPAQPADRRQPASVVRVHPSPLAGVVRVPGDKSISHRALLLGALVGSEVELANLAPGADVAATARALASMGATVTLSGDADVLGGQVSGPLGEPGDVIDCGNSGTSLRLIAGIAAGLHGTTVLTGDASLRRRPVDRIREPLVAMGAQVLARDGDHLPPLVVRGGGLAPVEWHSPVASAQVKSCLLLAGLTAGVEVTVHAPARSRDHTERMLEHLGLPVARRVEADGTETVMLQPGALHPQRIVVPGDPSSAAFWLVGAAVAGTSVTVAGIGTNPLRTGFLDVLETMGADVTHHDEREAAGEPVADVEVTAGALGGARVDGAAVVDCLDELPVLAVAGLASTGGIEVRDAGELRVKESDRIRTIVDTLAAIGVEVEEYPDGFRVPGGQVPRGGRVDAHGDHRIAMTAAVAATVSTGPVDIAGFDAVASSYPGFLDDLATLGGRAEVVERTRS